MARKRRSTAEQDEGARRPPDQPRGHGGADAAAAGFGEQPQSAFAVPTREPMSAAGGERVAGVRQRRLLRIGADGRVLIPADWRSAMELMDNDTLVAHLENGELTLHGARVGARKARALLRRHLPPGPSLADELIRERRQEAAAEDAVPAPRRDG